MRISANGAFAYVDFIVALKLEYNRKVPLIYSCYNRSEMELRSFTANISLANTVLYPEAEEQDTDISFLSKTRVVSYHTRMIKGKEPVSHSISISEEVGGKYLLTTKEKRDRDIYNWLMAAFDLPLLPEWASYLLDAGRENIKSAELAVYGRQPEWAKELMAYEVNLTEGVLQELVSNGLKKHEIFIAKRAQNPLQFDDMDGYFMKYGSSLIENLKGKLNPLTELKETVDEAAFLEKRFFPQQAAIVLLFCSVNDIILLDDKNREC